MASAWAVDAGIPLAFINSMAESNLAGALLGGLMAPFTGSISWLRRSRMFHPSGLTCRAEVRIATHDANALGVAERLGPFALLRWSSAWWKRREWPDVLGCAVRFTTLPDAAAAQPGDQDLLFATIRRPWTLPFAPLTTRQHDFLANDYHAVSPFEVAPLGRIEWRLRCESNAAPDASSRAERLRAAVAAHTGVVLEWAPYRRPWQAFDGSLFRPLVRLVMTDVVELDQERLRFDPFRAGRGIEPVGLIHGARRATYLASQLARAAHSG